MVEGAGVVEVLPAEPEMLLAELELPWTEVLAVPFFVSSSLAS